VKKEFGEIKVVLALSLFLWFLVVAFGWVALGFYDDWLNNLPIEFNARKLRIFNSWPNYMKLAIVIGGFISIFILAIHQTVKLYKRVFT